MLCNRELIRAEVPKRSARREHTAGRCSAPSPEQPPPPLKAFVGGHQRRPPVGDAPPQVAATAHQPHPPALDNGQSLHGCRSAGRALLNICPLRSLSFGHCPPHCTLPLLSPCAPSSAPARRTVHDAPADLEHGRELERRATPLALPQAAAGIKSRSGMSRDRMGDLQEQSGKPGTSRGYRSPTPMCLANDAHALNRFATAVL